jgi:hypothetical protein
MPRQGAQSDGLKRERLDDLDLAIERTGIY